MRLSRSVFAFALFFFSSSLQSQLLSPVTDGRGPWRTLTTKHFAIHFPAQQLDYALHAAKLFENIHRRLAPQYPPIEEGWRTNVTLVFSSDTVNAWATPYGLDQIVLYLEPPQQGEFARYNEWLEILFEHEYAHILSLRVWDFDTHPRLAIARIVTGVPPNLLLPFGLKEGISVHEESKQENVGRSEDALTRMTVRTAILTDTYPALLQILAGSRLWPYGQVGYLYGGRLFDELARLKGPSAIKRYWDMDQLPFVIDNRFYRLGTSIKELYLSRKERDRQEFETEAETLKRRGLTKYERLTFDGGVKKFLLLKERPSAERPSVDRPSAGRSSADRPSVNRSSVGGEGLLYFANPIDDIAGVYHLTTDGESDRLRRQFAVAGIAHAVGRHIYSEGDFLFPIFGLRYQLYNADLGEVMAPGRHIYYPTLSKNGQLLFFIERDDFRRYLTAARLNSEGRIERERRLFSLPYDHVLQYTALSPDNRYLLILARPQSVGTGYLYQCDLQQLSWKEREKRAERENRNEKEETVERENREEIKETVERENRKELATKNDGLPFCIPLLAGEGTKVAPRFLDNNNKIIFASDADGIYNFYMFNRKNGKTVRLTRTLGGLFYPTPGRDALYAIAYFENGYDIIRIAYKDLFNEEVTFFYPAAKRADRAAPFSDQEDDRKSGLVTAQWELAAVGAERREALPEGWEEGPYRGIWNLYPYYSGLIGLNTPSLGNLALEGRDPINHHLLALGVGYLSNDFPASAFWGAYSYNRYIVGLSFSYLASIGLKGRKREVMSAMERDMTENGESSTDGGEIREDWVQLANFFLSYFKIGRYLSYNLLLGYQHTRLAFENHFGPQQFLDYPIELNGPALQAFFDDTFRFPQSISPEKGWRLFLSTSIYNDGESSSQESINYAVMEGGLALYLPSFFRHHVLYLSGYGYSSLGRDREIQEVSLANYVRGLDGGKAPADHAAAVYTIEYRLPIFQYYGELFRDVYILSLRYLGLRLFYDYGVSFDRRPDSDAYMSAYGFVLISGVNFLYIDLPQLQLTFAQGVGEAGESRISFSFAAEFPDAYFQTGRRSSFRPYRPPLPYSRREAGYFRNPAAGGFLE